MDNKRFTIQRISGAVMGLAFVLCTCSAGCPERSTVVPLNVNKFTGKWFMLAGTPTSGNSVSSCCELLIASSSPDTFSLNFTAMSRRSHGPVTFFMNATINEDVTGTWQLQGSNRTLGPFKHRVIAVNYDSYVVMVVCGENNPDLPLHGFSMILARNKNLSSTILEEQKKILSVYFSRDMIIDVDHNNC